MGTSSLSAAAKAARNEYARKWRAANKERVKEANERYWAKRAEREAAEQAEQEKGVQKDEG